ncbi:MAG: hypothetical protein KatS3mg020_0942 [Fimbriimonadales bacterium]|nr:MAG: hypothetical protein KatS3mg020_0942 [Fimbriimonadales bacterium]
MPILLCEFLEAGKHKVERGYVWISNKLYGAPVPPEAQGVRGASREREVAYPNDAISRNIRQHSHSNFSSSGS